MQNIQYFPGHHTKTQRQIEADIKLVDLVAEVIDARIPMSSRNPDVDQLTVGKPRMIVLNRADQADPAQNKAWTAYFKKQNWNVLETNAKSGAGVNQFPAAVRTVLKEQIAAWQAKGQVGRPIRVMVVGVPNVGKSTFINKVARRKSAKAENRPGVTRGKQWVTIDRGLELLDTPGILWPKFEDQQIAMRLAFTGAIKDDVLDIDDLACELMELLVQRYPSVIQEKYKLTVSEPMRGWQALELVGRKRGFLISGGEVDLSRAARLLLDDYRSGKLGRFTLERPEEFS
ncbi:MAG: ribosome biogenesis GTPase YlqF [Oscillospiraceae bacterium]|nr:ribosome biogenesis GTPase YlqF [Oscillospiraceae bacterium]